jgi:3-oxoacyl-[acyl-carrier-protein] synthase-3
MGGNSVENYAQITGWGKYLPQRVLYNKDLERMVETSDEWIITRTGIRERHIAAAEETASTMATEAARQALEVAGLSADQVELIILATNTPDSLIPAASFRLQENLGAKRAAAFDLVAGCSGFVHALAVASQFITSGAYRNILVVGSEVMSRVVDWHDRNTCVLFGDGAGAVMMQAGDSPSLLSFTLGADGYGTRLIHMPGLCGRPGDLPPDGKFCLFMNGKEVFRLAVIHMVEATKDVVAAAGLEPSHIELVIPHQANGRIIQATAERLGIPNDRVFVNVDRYGNVAAASPALALCEAVEQGRVRKGDHIILVAFGAGLSWAATVIQWQKETVNSVGGNGQARKE